MKSTPQPNFNLHYLNRLLFTGPLPDVMQQIKQNQLPACNSKRLADAIEKQGYLEYALQTIKIEKVNGNHY